MTTRIFALSGAAGLVLAGALMATTPATAQYWRSESTPAEKAATSQLNVHAGVITHTDSAAEAEYARAQAEYQQKLNAHNAELERHQTAQRLHDDAQRMHTQNETNYQRELREYENERALYEFDARVYEDIRANLDDRRFAILTHPGRFWEVTRLSPAQLDGMLVKDRYGNVVGQIRAVDARRLMVRLDSGNMVWVRYPRLRYDVNGRVLLTDLAYADIVALPRAVAVYR